MKKFGFLPLNLQLFAGTDEDLLEDEELEQEEETEETEEDTEETEDETEEEETEETEEETEEKPPQKKDIKPNEPDDSTPWVKKRLARAERSFERKFMDEVASLSEGVQVQKDELPKAARLWNVLKYNPELSKQVDELINTAVTEGKLKDLKAIQPTAQMDRLSSKLELKEAELELRYSDPVYKKHEQEIKDWAEDEGLEITNPRTLKLAYKAWKGENAALLAANAQPQNKQKSEQKTQERKSAKLASGRSPGKSTKIDYRKASDRDILDTLGLKLFVDD